MKLSQTHSALTVKFGVLQCGLWSAQCAFYSFLVLLLTRQGYSAAFAGAVTSTAICTGILGRIFWGLICDRRGSLRATFVLLMAAYWASGMAFLLEPEGGTILVLAAVLGFVMHPQPSVLDAWIFRESACRPEEPIHYGQTRLWGTIGYSITAVALGRLIDWRGFSVCYWFLTALVAATIVTALLLPSPQRAAEGISAPGDRQNRLGPALRELLSSRRFLIFLLCSLFSGLAIQTISVFASLFVNNVGGDTLQVGLTMFAGAILELFPFYLAVQLQRRLGIYRVLQLSMGIYLFQYLFLFLARNPWQVMFGMLFQGLAYGLFLPAFRVFAHEEAPEELKATAISLSDSVFGGVGGMVGASVGGLLIDRFGVGSIPVSAALLMVLSFLFLTQLRRSSRRREKIPGR